VTPRAAARAAAACVLSLPLLAWQSPAGAPERLHGGIVRGPTAERRIALEFTGHEFAEGGSIVLDELARRGVQASFFLTGDFLRTEAFARWSGASSRTATTSGPTPTRHLLYCDWEAREKTLVTRAAFARDLEENLRAIEAFGVPRSRVRFWVPAYEWYNDSIAAWGAALGLTLVNFTPGTRSTADYTGEADRNFVPSQRIVESILAREREDPHGLNGYLLLLHIGAGPGRADKMHDRLGGLLDELSRGDTGSCAWTSF